MNKRDTIRIELASIDSQLRRLRQAKAVYDKRIAKLLLRRIKFDRKLNEALGP